MTGFAGHWHGYGPWIGPRSEFAKESLRRPGPHPDHPQTHAFLASTMTPVQLGHSLLRRPPHSRTWTDLEDALRWVRATREENPAAGSLLPPEQAVDANRDTLRLGSDICHGYYTSSGTFVSFCVVCCPNRFFPDLPCPLPPA